jgi:hypothetical protein
MERGTWYVPSTEEVVGVGGQQPVEVTDDSQQLGGERCAQHAPTEEEQESV